jgi:hypothetical protein
MAFHEFGTAAVVVTQFRRKAVGQYCRSFAPLGLLRRQFHGTADSHYLTAPLLPAALENKLPVVRLPARTNIEDRRGLDRKAFLFVEGPAFCSGQLDIIGLSGPNAHTNRVGIDGLETAYL